jgi:uroporphyrinogen decarboxylase
MVLSRGARLVAPMLAPLGASLLGVDPVAVRGARQVQLHALEALQEHFSPDLAFPLMDLSAGIDAVVDLLGEEFIRPGISVREAESRLALLDEVEVIDPEEHPSMIFQLNLAAEMRSTLDVPVATFTPGPFHLAGQLFGPEEMLLWAVSGERCLAGIMGFATRLLGGYLGTLGQQADLVMLVEPELAMLAPSYFDSICQPFLQGLAGIIRSTGSSPALHLCGDSRHLLEHLIPLGMECVSFDSAVDLVKAAKVLPLNLIILGNLDVRRLELSSPVDVRDKVRRLLRDMSGYRNFILSSGCEVTPETSLDNMEAFFEAARDA